ncbi:MAG: EMC3/TMCO1 family protein [archaeon]|jgi:uncharacterized membrane protein (DUF106 family)|nr:DUF106 domain-containing protein [Candidatus Bathyarchaeota archaeon]
MYTQVLLELSTFQQPPYATLAIIAISMTLATITSYIGVRSLDLEQYRRLMIQSARARREVMEATRSGNQRRIDKAQKRQQELMQQQSKMSMDRMRSSMLFTVPMLLIWPSLGRFFGDTIVAYFPFDFPRIPREFTFIQWYLLCSFTMNVLMNRLFGLTFEIDPED